MLLVLSTQLYIGVFMTVNIFQDSEKKVILPSEIEFENGETLPIEDVQFQTVVDDDRIIVAINIQAELDDGGTVTNHITFHGFGEIGTDAGLYLEDPDNYEHPVDDRSYDTVVFLSDNTLDRIEIKLK